MDWKVGNKVRHSTAPQWGLGEVIEVVGYDRVRVYFVDGGEKLLANTNRMLTRITGREADTAIVIPRRQSVPRLGRAASTKPRRSIQEYRAVFLEKFPLGFKDWEYVKRERVYKIEAGKLLATSLDASTFNQLLADEDYAEVCRLARAVVNKTNLIYPNEKMDLKDGLRTAENQKRFCEALFPLLHSAEDDERHFGEFASMLNDIGASKWTIATYFSYLMHPDRHMFLKPRSTQRIATACNVALNYQKALNWLTYKSLLTLADRLAEELVDLHPRDRIDLQSFTWVVAR